jgi:hypothetical protein
VNVVVPLFVQVTTSVFGPVPAIVPPPPVVASVQPRSFAVVVAEFPFSALHVVRDVRGVA